MKNTINLTQEQQAEIEKAYTLGAIGYYEGKKAPAQDAKLMSMIGGIVGTLQILDAWNKGWMDKYHEETNKEVAKIFAAA